MSPKPSTPVFWRKQAPEISTVCIFPGPVLWYNKNMKRRKETKGILILKDHNEGDEIDFELDYLLSLSTSERFHLMENKSREVIHLLEQHGHRRPAEIIKRQ